MNDVKKWKMKKEKGERLTIGNEIKHDLLL